MRTNPPPSHQKQDRPPPELRPVDKQQATAFGSEGELASFLDSQTGLEGGVRLEAIRLSATNLELDSL